MNFKPVMLGLELSTVDIVLVTLFAITLAAIIFYAVAKKIFDTKTTKIVKNEFDRLNVMACDGAEAAVAEEDVKKNKILAKKEEKTEVLEDKPQENVTEEDKPQEDVKEEEKPQEDVKEEEETQENVADENIQATEDVVFEKTTEAEALEENNTVVENSDDTPETKEQKTLNDTDKDSEKTTEEVLEENEMVEKAKRQYSGKYEIFKENQYYRYRLKASNGEVLFVSEVYASRDGAVKSIAAVQRNLEKGKIEIFADKRKNYKFQLKAANHRVLAISSNYPSSQGAQNASESFKRFATTLDIVDVELPREELADSSLIEIKKVKEEDKRGGKFVLKKDTHGVFSWELKASNGEILCQADGYSSKSSLETSIDSFKVSVNNGRFFIYADKSDNYQFKLYSQSGRVAMVGESYSTSQQAQSVVTSILNFLDLAQVVDKTVAPVKKTAKPKTEAAKKPAAKKATKK